MKKKESKILKNLILEKNYIMLNKNLELNFNSLHEKIHLLLQEIKRVRKNFNK